MPFYLNMEPKIKYEKVINEINQSERPIIFINGLTHGDERIGQVVINKLKDLKINSGTLLTNIANEKAFEKGVRFIEHDLNRIAPGNETGDYEEQVAFYISEIAGKADVFIDIHSTESSLKNSIIVREMSNEVKKFLEVINPETVLVMEVTDDGVLLAHAKIGIAFEYGNDNDQEATDCVVRDIKKILKYLNMIDEFVPEEKKEAKIFYVRKIFEKNEGDILSDSISNLSLVRKGDTVATTKDGNKIVANEDFFPVLFSQNGYKDIFGFVGFLG